MDLKIKMCRKDSGYKMSLNVGEFEYAVAEKESLIFKFVTVS